MKPNELRVGNIIEKKFLIWGSEAETYWQWSYVGIDEFKDVEKYSENYRALELNDGWLLRLGFKEETKRWNTTRWFSFNGFGFWMDSMALFSIGDHYIAGCKYVHQLQNLYFALTGEEIKIK